MDNSENHRFILHSIQDALHCLEQQNYGLAKETLFSLQKSIEIMDSTPQKESHVYPYFREAMQCHLQTSPPLEKE